jgi:hypothetical protein
MSCEALKSLFKNEDKHGGEATVEAVQLIAELVKIRHCRLRPSVLEVHSYFLCCSESFVCFYGTGLFNRAFAHVGSLLPWGMVVFSTSMSGLMKDL